LLTIFLYIVQASSCRSNNSNYCMHQVFWLKHHHGRLSNNISCSS